jgi:hypothetical protein
VDLTLDAIQNPIVDAYLEALPAGIAPRILASRTAFVADSDDYALKVATPGLTRQAQQHRAAGHAVKGDTVTDYRRQFDAHIGSPETVLRSLQADSVLRRATDISFQVHSVEPTHRDTLRSIELIAEHIAPTSFEETPMSLSQDILAELAEIKPGSPLAEARARGMPPRATPRAATKSYLASRIAILRWTSASPWRQKSPGGTTRRRWPRTMRVWPGRPDLRPSDPGAEFRAPADLLPVEATPTALRALTRGMEQEGIVTLAQLIAFVSFQSRLIAGLRLLNDRPVAKSDAPVAAGVWHTTATTAPEGGPVAFTQQELGWEPWIAAKPLADFRDDEVAILAKFGHTDSDYFRLLGRNLPVLEQRTLTDKGIFIRRDCRAPSASWPQRSPVKSTAAFTAHLSMRVKPASCQRMTRR